MSEGSCEIYRTTKYLKMVVAFDLDDTLFPERDYLHSAYREIATIISNKYGISFASCLDAMLKGGFDALISLLDGCAIAHEEDVMWCVNTYRHHKPDIKLSPIVKSTLSDLKRRGASIALITDGRIITQTLKIEGLSLYDYICPDNISISEAIGADKSQPLPFLRVMQRHPNEQKYVYVGDNPKKDFFHPNALGWKTIGLLDSGNNIHKQTFDTSPEYQPQYWVKKLNEIIPLLY